MKSLNLVLAVAIYGLCGCTGGGAQTEELPIPTPSRQQAIDLMYDSSYQTPNGFFTDRPSTIDSYSLYHVKNPGNDYELCTDEIEEARDLEAADNAQRAIGGIFVEIVTTDRYFQIERVLDVSGSVGNTGLTEPGYARVPQDEAHLETIRKQLEDLE